MRILVVSNLYPPNVVGGYERLCFEVTEALAAAGHEITVLTSDYGGRVAAYPGQRVLRELRLLAGADIYTPFGGTADERDALNRGNIASFTRVVRETRPDVVFAWNLFFFDGSLLDAMQQQAVRTVLMLTDNWLLVMRNPVFVSEFFRTVVHGDAPFQPAVAAPAPGLPSRAVAMLGRLLGRSPGGVPGGVPGLDAVFGSDFVRDLYAAGGSTFPRHRVIHNGVRQQAHPSMPAPDRTRLVRPGTLRLLFAGRLVDLKGAHTAVEALPLLDAASLGLDRVELTVLGDMQDAAYLPVLHGAIERSGCADRIALRPAVAEDELPALFADHDLYLFPSLYEPFSLTLIHALAMGIPTIASRVGGNTEIVADGESGLLFAKGDAADLAGCIRRLAADGVLRGRLAAGGRRSAGRFTFERMVGGMAEFLAGPGSS